MEDQLQQQTPQSEKPKKKFYKNWWFWVILVICIIIVGFGIYYYLGIQIPCGYLLGWENTPCTSDHTIDNDIKIKYYKGSFAEEFHYRVQAFDTPQGIIYIESVCEPVFDVGINYFNSEGRYIANCGGLSATIEPPGRNRATCDWLTDQHTSNEIKIITACPPGVETEINLEGLPR